MGCRWAMYNDIAALNLIIIRPRQKNSRRQGRARGPLFTEVLFYFKIPILVNCFNLVIFNEEAYKGV